MPGAPRSQTSTCDLMGLSATGTQVGVDPLPYRLDYTFDAADGWVTRSLSVEVTGEAGPAAWHLPATQAVSGATRRASSVASTCRRWSVRSAIYPKPSTAILVCPRSRT